MNIGDLYRRAMMMLGIGTVSSSTDSGTVQTIQYKSGQGLEVRGNTPRMAEFGFSSGLPAGSDVVLAFLGGDRSNAIVIATNNQSYRHAGLKSGETVIYNQWGMHVKLTEEGIEIEAQDQPVTVRNATTVTVTATDRIRLETPNLQVTGDITDNCDSQSATLKQLRDAYNQHDHDVPDVDPGSATITSRPPSEKV
ncbi:phage baseplate assembly protein [Brenneria populi subsp. brevivirga]|uniref:phage baseplate assembly protein domain-containing protein n=1 Tax=Brenneria populi TaxID=1505588 RepID=UPI002E199F00|nr:phage baseplate assembly protein [Brenneria populi subsp. brevivirga]